MDMKSRNTTTVQNISYVDINFRIILTWHSKIGAVTCCGTYSVSTILPLQKLKMHHTESDLKTFINLNFEIYHLYIYILLNLYPIFLV
jgi:hypothetical protein